MRMVVRYIVTNIHVGNREFKMKLHQTIQEKEDHLYLNLFDSKHALHLHVVTLIEQINAACTYKNIF